jgi:hypothetical protein
VFRRRCECFSTLNDDGNLRGASLRDLAHFAALTRDRRFPLSRSRFTKCVRNRILLWFAPIFLDVGDRSAMVTRGELLKLLDGPEDNFVERKPARVNARAIRQTLVAFANSVPDGREAVLFIGVRDDGVIEGCPNPDSTQKSVGEISQQQCYPPIAFKCEVLQDRQSVVAVIVPPSKNRPHFSGPAFVRKGSMSVAASPEMFDELVHSRNSKVAELLSLRDKHTILTVIGIGHRLGTVTQTSERAYREGEECKVVNCDAHSAHLYKIGPQINFSEPLEHIQVSYDHEKHRPMLVVTGY